MTRDHASAPRLACLLLPVLLLAALPGQAACPPEGHDRASLEALRAAGFQVAPPQREALASGLLDCLGDPDPGLRDGIAYEALMSWMRAGAFDPPVLRRLRDRLQAMLGQEDPAGFRGPFAALVLAEVARTDRIRPWMSAQERSAMVAAAAAWLTGVDDYRGFVAGEGWRHGVAHGADWLMQLALNPAIEARDADAILAAVASQVIPAGGHAYVFGEPERLARPLLFLGQRGLLSPGHLEAWLSARQAALQPARPGDADWLAARHDLQAFLRVLYVETGATTDPALARLHPVVAKALRPPG